ncbi:MAG TPA: NUDIX domain-containing protein [Candidatus Dormibacteraeota bacterium]|nr:NUDIX domain-containing protein [Candidatus Dormibacteraeota bacterium]
MAHYCIHCGAQLVEREIDGRVLEACPNDDFVLWRDPKVATAVVVEVDGGIVLGRRAIEPALGHWCLPGGFVNDDEGPMDAAARECLEEIGASVVVAGLVGVYHIAKRGAPSMIAIGYRARVVEGTHLAPGAEMLELQVFPATSLPELAFPSHQQIVGDYVRSLASREEGEPRPAGATARRASPPSRARGRSRPRRTR